MDASAPQADECCDNRRDRGQLLSAGGGAVEGMPGLPLLVDEAVATPRRRSPRESLLATNPWARGCLLRLRSVVVAVWTWARRPASSDVSWCVRCVH